MFKIVAIDLKKSYGVRKIFSNISFTLNHNNVLGITGKNGSGKSTLVKIIAGVLSPNKGELKYYLDNRLIDKIDFYRYYGFVSPYIQLYDEFTAYENIEMISKIRNMKVNSYRILSLFEKFNLQDRKDDYVREYSSGMKQRLKYIAAVYHEPPLLILDEPRSNLDIEGIKVVYDLVSEYKKKGSVIIATNDIEDIKYCDYLIKLDEIELKKEQNVI